MYSDQDGWATAQSQAVYSSRIRLLLSLTSVLSWLGFGAALLEGQYAAPIQTNTLEWSKYLWPLLSCHSLSLHWVDNPIQLYSGALRGLCLSALIVLSILCMNAFNCEYSLLTLSLPSLQLYAAALAAIIQSLFPRRPNLFTPEGKAVDTEGSASALSKYTLQWCTDALVRAGKPVSLRELPALNFTTRSKSQPLLGLDMGKASLWSQIVHQRSFGLAKQWTLMLLRSAVSFGSPYCTMRLLNSLEDSHGRTDAAWIWLAGLGIFSFSQTMINYHLVWIQWSEMGIPVRAQLIMSIFHKALRLKDDRAQTEKSSKKPGKKGTASSAKPEALNLLSSDTVSFSKFTAVNYIIPSLFVRFVFAIIFLVELLGWQSTLVGMTATLACIPIHAHVVKQQRIAKKNLTAARDKKTEVISEAINSLRQIKFSASEAQWEEYIGIYRQQEIEHIRRNFTAGNVKSAWGVAAPFIVAGASSFAYMCLHGALAPSIIFPMIELLPHLEGTLGFAPFVLQDYFGARSNADRMEYYLRKKEHKNVLDGSPSGGVIFRNASVTWPSAAESDNNDDTPSHHFSLHGLSLEFPVGELSIITGKTGSGKSLLLNAILGEADILNGHIQAPSMSDGQPVAFVSQSPWLQNATIKENILFGSPLDNERYEKVLAACSLKPDIALLEKGDETMIGLRGLKLSGGQRARVALARAFYSSARLLVLDDVFSSLDAHVANDILVALTGDIGAGRTRILVTHQVSLCLPKAKYIVHIQNNTIDYADDPESVGRKQGLLKAEKASNAEHPTALRPAVQENNKIDAVKKLTRPKVHHDPKTKKAKKARSDLKVSLLATLSESLFKMHAASGSMRASESLFREMTFRVLRMPLVWLDATPTGTMLKRFTSDTRMVDDSVFDTISEFAYCLVKLGIVIGIGLYSSKYTVLLTIAVLCWCVQVSSAYIRARTTVRHADSKPNADILEHFTASAAGVSTIRAFGVASMAIEKMHQHIDELSTARRHFWVFNRWLGLQMSFAGILFSLGTGIILLSSSSTVEASSVGFALAFSTKFSKTIFNVVDKFGVLETHMDAAGALIGYSELENEQQDGGSEEINANWPERGKVEVKNLNVAYPPGLPLVLKDVTFNVDPGTRIAIVGRTGAGKSSLALSLLRLLVPQDGSIWIDDIDISTIKLQRLRSKITFIPQDPILFSGTVRSNLDYFSHFSDNRLTEVLRHVKLLPSDEKSAGPFSLDSTISAGGSNISQGERQLFCLARALLKNSRIIVLDEATSAIDTKTESFIREEIMSEFSGTLIVVAHRLSTVARFDHIMVMSDGKVVESGAPAKLLKAQGSFYDLVKHSEDKESLTETILNSKT
ncbi:hypothetical protein UA08_01523 [Talaromyces atroroseus]|uniref:Uncharacterized protein n=1 Tax=Talaromyces atroroseus TaxID=1441469 RepID=A0A1Q5QA10_TALAT|nr:hypothetical protein UA08_01523 [Talaromyces atroroseus]OKL62783.1 hypothetical protein UA08_01523 [Talaromyces atroroseus]